MTWKDNADLAIAEAISQGQEEPFLVEAYILIVAGIDQAGEQKILGNAMPGQLMATTLGLLRMGQLIEDEGFRSFWFEDDEDDE